MPDLDRIRVAAREWLGFIGDLDSRPVVVVPPGDPEDAEEQARIRLARVLRDELFEPERHGPIYVWSGEHPLRGRHQHWGGSDIWRCDEHPGWEGEELGTWEAHRDFVAGDAWQGGRTEADVRDEWEAKSVEAHAETHAISLG